MLESLCNNRRRFSKLEHLELCNLSLGTLDNEQDMDTLCRCLAHLRSISLRFEDPAIYSHVMDRICLCIASNPDLECLMVTTKLSAFSIESLLRNCQKLRYLSWHSTDPVDYDELHLLMDAVREGQPTPTRREVEKLLHVSVVGCFSENVGDMPSHPWIKYHESDFGDSPIANEIKFANVEKKL
ncbi:hypothetical protein DdX_18580 [Ditylenchus destructor]|uniref:Uncharacterized protein n=1 Tax=Ditylenchus destructor TaxID=166010 RepID=A0AAD4MLA9_9BILA|nr:hypothetical protein DdX_18580 [Ditylenchus destructor]